MEAFQSNGCSTIQCSECKRKKNDKPPQQENRGGVPAAPGVRSAAAAVKPRPPLVPQPAPKSRSAGPTAIAGNVAPSARLIPFRSCPARAFWYTEQGQQCLVRHVC